MASAFPILQPNQFVVQHLRELGQGGLGQVDEVLVAATNCPGKPIGSRWARKRLNPKWDTNPQAVERFEREIRALGRMQHRNIVTLEGENVAGERFYLMPVYNDSVRRHIASGQWTGNWASVARQGRTLAEAMQYAHGQGFIHRDLKPDNILFNHQEPLVITDWGLGYFVHKHSKVLQQLTRGGMGTEYYCSLEQWSTGKCDERGDVYSLGMTLDEWVRGSQRRIVVGMGFSEPSVAPSSAGAIRFNATLVRMTQVLKSSRIPSMHEVASELQAALALDGL